MDNDTIEKVKECILINKEITSHKNKIKELNKRLLQINVNIKDKMKRDDLDIINTSTGKICHVVSTVKKSFSKKTLFDLLVEYNKELEHKINVDELVKYLIENRESSVKESIKYVPK